jgi:Flp pilus assembly protein TadD
LKGSARAYALLFDRQFREAVPVLKETLAKSPPAEDGHVRVLLAWALLESGQPKEAWDQLQTYPIPRGASEPPLQMLVFPRLFQLRAVALERLGRKEEAKKEYDLFRKYAGDLPSVFGPEAPPE